MNKKNSFIKIGNNLINLNEITYIFEEYGDYILCVTSGKSITISETAFNKIVEKLELGDRH